MRIGIVNDVALAREALRRVVLSVPGAEVAWLACDGVEAVAEARRDRPDLILMDLYMPRVDGVEATRRIIAETPCPILVVTATVTGHICKVYEAMGHGALDAVDTPTLGTKGEVNGASALLDKIATIGKLIGNPVGSPVEKRTYPTMQRRPSMTTKVSRLLLIGSSTGGPSALKQILSELPAALPVGVIIVQHVDKAFAPGLVSWLSEYSKLPVEVAAEGGSPQPGKVLVASTNDHLIMDAQGRLRYVAEPCEACYRPSVDVLFQSVAEYWASPGVATLLTGMGRDGAAGLLQLRQRGWHTIAQDQATSVIWGMPQAAVERGAAVEVLPLDRIAAAIADRLQ